MSTIGKLCMALMAACGFLAVAAGCAAPSPPGGNSLTLVGPDEPGERITIRGTIVDRNGRPVAGAGLHIYQTDASGRYTPERPMNEPNARPSGRSGPMATAASSCARSTRANTSSR